MIFFFYAGGYDSKVVLAEERCDVRCSSRKRDFIIKVFRKLYLWMSLTLEAAWAR